MNRVLILIPMRGRTQGIPNKYTRLMNGKPLLFYVIHTATELKKSFDADVVVDTDDEEIAEVSRQYGAEIVRMSSDLAENGITTDTMIHHAVCVMEERYQKSYDIIMAMQASAPTLKIQTAAAALNTFIKSNDNIMISGISEAHTLWAREDDVIRPICEKGSYMKQPSTYFRESGAFLITKRKYVTEENRQGKKVSLYELPAEEAIDIVSDADWIACESILKSKRIILRADGAEQLGMGHIYRALSLAYHLIGHEILFVTKKDCLLGVEKLGASSFQTKYIDHNDEIFDIIESFQPDIVVNDILDTEQEYINRMKQLVPRVITFEDRGEGAAYADAVINALYEGKPGKNAYMGHNYFFLRDEFMTVVPKTFSEKVRNVVVMFGGSDPSDLTRKTYKILQNIAVEYPDVEFHIITGFGYKYKHIVKDDEVHHIYVHNDVKRVSRYLAEADMAITAQGRTIFELASMGVPSIVLAQNRREVEHIFARFSNGFINLGLGNEQEAATIQSTIGWLIQTPNIRRQMRDTLLEKDLSGSQKRVIQLILGETDE